MTTSEFQEIVWKHARTLYRHMPWRDEPTLYNVLVSELMLQQTQVPRVLTKFAEFTHAFPTVEALAAAGLADVLRVWQGLGYNRRAKFLHEAAKHIVAHGEPKTRDELVKLPGVGANTAAAIMNYVYEVPTPFVETNIRTVYFYHFFRDRTNISDKELLSLVTQTIDHEQPREWFWALMDYGAELKRQGHGRLDMSKHYKKQPPLKGSVREVRGQILRELSRGNSDLKKFRHNLADDTRYQKALQGLLRDGLITEENRSYHLTK